MADKSTAPKTYVDFLNSMEGGMNSGVSPLLLQKNQIGFGLNTSLRGGFLKTRPPFQKKTLNYGGNAAIQAIVESGMFQGAQYYRPDYGPESLLAQIAGHSILFTEIGSSWLVTDVSVPGDLNDPTVNQVWMWKTEKWMITQDGTGAQPIFFNGTTSRRSNGFSVQLGTLAANFVPPNPRVIGEIDTLTLTAPFTGNYNLPVIFNGEFYQPLQVYKVSLKNVSDTAGNAIAQGTQAIVTPSKAGFLTATLLAGTLVGGCIPAGRVYLPTYVSSLLLPIIPGDITLLDTNGNGRTFHLSSSGKISTPVKICFTGTQTHTWPLGQVITYAGAMPPNTILGKFLVGFSAPAVGASITVNLDTPYTGASNQPVWINGKQYLISQVIVPPTPSSSLALVNLTDLKTATVPIGAIVVSVPEIPPGRMGAYGMGCNAVCLVDGISYIIGDVVGGGSGTPAEDYRDAVLKITQNTFLRGGGAFRLPGAGDIINAMWFPPVLDGSLGQGPLEIGTAFNIWSNNVPGTDPINWATVTFPIQSETLKDKGPLGQNSTVLVNSDSFFRSYEGISALILARRDFSGWGNRPLSNELQRVLNNDIQSLLRFGSAIVFDNRFISTAAPQVSGRGVFHMALASMNFDLVSSMITVLPPAWEGIWTGINVFQLLTGRVNGSKRAFAFTLNINLNTIELYELLPENSPSYLDNDVTPILRVFETAVTFGQDIKPLTELVQLHDGEVYLSDIKDEANVKVYYRPDYYPCWTLWHEFTVCAAFDAANSKPGYRMRIGLGEPSPDACEIGNNRPLRLGYFFQYRVETTNCTWKGLRVSAVAMPQPAFALVECDEQTCQIIDCDLPDDLRIYSLQGLPPQPLLPVVRPPLFLSEQVEATVPNCDPINPLVYDGVLPTWIIIDPTNPCNLIGVSGTFSGQTQDEANALAVAALSNIANSGSWHIVVSTGGLVAYYKMDEATGSRLDVVGGHTLTEANGAVGSTAGIISDAANFVSVASPFNLDRLVSNGSSTPLFFSGSFSISGWFKADLINTYFYMTAGAVNQATYSWQLAIKPGTNGVGFFGNYYAPYTASWGAQCDFPADINWHHVVVVFDFENQILIYYIDGLFEVSSPQPLVVATIHFGDYVGFVCGDAGGGGSAAVDELGFWSRVLTPAEVTLLYNGGAGLPCTIGFPPFILP